MREIVEDGIAWGAGSSRLTVTCYVRHLRHGDIQLWHVGEDFGKQVGSTEDATGNFEDGPEGQLECEIVVGVLGGVVQRCDSGLREADGGDVREVSDWYPEGGLGWDGEFKAVGEVCGGTGIDPPVEDGIEGPSYVRNVDLKR